MHTYSRMQHISYIAVVLLLVACVRCDNSTALDNTCELQPWQAGPWGALLEEWATSVPEHSGRQGRILALPSKGYYVVDRIDGPLMPPPPPQPRPYDEWQPSPAPPSPGKIVNRPPNPYKDKFKPSYPAPQPKPIPAYQQSPQTYTHRPNSVDRVDEPPRRQVSETDLYLLSAIEKLVYRVDLMEKRMRRMEESLHLLVAGTEPKQEPCVYNFTRVGGSCYHISSEPLDWKSANLACRKLRANLLELDSDTERHKIFAFMQTEKGLRGSDWWTGGLNPGLLWIWSNSGRPIAGNTTTAAGAGNTTQSITIVGDGRCLALIYDPAAHTYVYRGQDCALRHRFVCEKKEDKAKLSNEIERVARKLKTIESIARKPKILWNDENN